MNVNIVCAIDNNYIQHCAVMLHSLHEQNPHANLTIFIIHNGLKEKPKKRLDHFLHTFAELVTFIKIDDTILDGCPLSCHISLATYFRLFIPKVLPMDIQKVLFLDSDIIIRKSIIPFWETDISQYSHAAVEDPNKEEDKERLGIPPSSSYFNAGVLLINLDFWRQEQIFDRALQFIEEQNSKIVWWDQDVLNFLLQGCWLPVDSTWNAQGVYYSKEFFECNELQWSKYQLTATDPSIVHFSGGGKPWGRKCSHPFAKDYHKNLVRTPWAINFLLNAPSRIGEKLKTGVREKVYALSQRV